MEIKIGSYIIEQRTQYSKFKLIDAKTNKDITKTSEKILEKVLDDYYCQKSFPKRYFNIKNNQLIRFVGEDIKYVFIPEDVKIISPLVFDECNIYEINLPQSLIAINDFAFNNCHYLKTINIPNDVYYLGVGAFKNCNNLENVALSSSLIEIKSFTFYCCEKLKKINLPDTVISVGNESFTNNKSLEFVRLPKKLKFLNERSFTGCTNLSKIDLPISLEKIGSGCFSNCSSLKEIDIPNSVLSLGNEVFAGCISLETVKLPNRIYTLENKLFENCKKLKAVDLPDAITTICENVFLNTDNLKSINIPKKIKSVILPVFYNTGLDTLIINSDLNSSLLSTNDKYDLLSGSNINRLVIKSSVWNINPKIFKYSGSQITSIDYLGTKKRFETFKENNKLLFNEYLTNIKKINFIEKDDKNIYTENINR